MKETELMHLIRGALTATGKVVLWRSNTGFDAKNRVRYGLGVGGADLVGLLKTGRFFAVEVKTPTGRVSAEQTAWIAVVNAAGGYACVARSVAEALDHLDAAGR